MTLNYLQRRNGVILHYFSEFGYLPGVLRKSSRSLSHLLMSSCSLSLIVSQLLSKTFYIQQYDWQVILYYCRWGEKDWLPVNRAGLVLRVSLERPGYLELQAFHQRLEDLGRLPLHGLPAITLLNEFSDDYNKFFYCDGVVGVLVINSLEKVKKSMIKGD